MTHSGGKPHDVGDRGQRYEVTFIDPGGTRTIFGWSETLKGAETMVSSIEKHPVWEDGEIRDRDEKGPTTMQGRCISSKTPYSGMTRGRAQNTAGPAPLRK